MKGYRLAALVLSLLLSASAAHAAPILTNGTNTAWIGENNHFYLQTEGSNTKVLNTAMKDLISMDDERFYALTQTNAIYGILLDGTSIPSVLTTVATEDDIAALQKQPSFRLELGVLTVAEASGLARIISEKALYACANGDMLYYAELLDDMSTALKASPLDGGLEPDLLPLAVKRPLSLTASNQYVTLVAEDRSIQIVDLASWQLTDHPALSDTVDTAFCMNGELYTFTRQDTGSYMFVDKIGIFAPPTAVPTQPPTLAPTTLPTATPAPTATPKPTAKPTPKATVNPTAAPTGNQDDGRISKGDRGNSVRRMQQRLVDLGYPLEKVDGVFGNDTLNAVHLFQGALGATQRSYMSVSNLSKLYDTNAPVYDPYLPLKKDSRGVYVKMMQARLTELGYDPGKIDGVYGTNTIRAAAEFQITAGFIIVEQPKQPKQGEEMTREMLMLLYDPINAPAKPTPTPIPTVTPLPTPVPTESPTVVPSIEPATKTDLI